MSKYTPGPWEWDGCDLWHIGNGYMPSEKDNPHLYTGIKLDERLYKSEVLQANARLISAAPDLADVAKAVVRFYQGLPYRIPVELYKYATEALRKAGEIPGEGT